MIKTILNKVKINIKKYLIIIRINFIINLNYFKKY